MKNFLGILVLIFTLQTPSLADDIRDFQIEGMSVGDSLLDYFSKEEIKKHTNAEHLQFPNKKFTIVHFDSIGANAIKSLKVYEAVRLSYKTSSKKYIIHEIAGAFYYEDNFKDCFNKKDKIVKEISQIFKDSAKQEGEQKHQHDKTGNSKFIQTNFTLPSGDGVSVTCYDWSDKMVKTGLWDQLEVSLVSKEYIHFLLSEAFK